MRGLIVEKKGESHTILFEDGQLIDFDEKSFPRQIKVGDVVTMKFTVQRSDTQRLEKIRNRLAMGEG